MKAAVRGYFGIDISKIDPAQAAIIAGLPKSPSNYDLVRNSQEKCTTEVANEADCPKTQSVVPKDATIVQRRNQILELLAAGRTPMSGTQYSSAQFTAAEDEPVVLGSQATPRWIAPHFVWAVRDELADQAVRRRPVVRRARSRRAAGHHDPRRRPPEDRREVGPRPRPSSRTRRT